MSVSVNIEPAYAPARRGRNQRNSVPSIGWSYVFSGVRPSSGAETQGGPVAFGQSEPLERADVAVAEDGRTALNTFGWKRGPVRESSELCARIAPLNCLTNEWRFLDEP